MIPRSILAFCIAILFSSAPTWADPMKFKSGGGSSNPLHFVSSDKSFHSNIKFLGGFKSESKKHDGFSNFQEDHFVLVVPFGTDSQGSNDGPNNGPNDSPSSDPVSTPEPGALTLLLAGALGLGALAYRRRASLVAAR